MFDKIFAQKRLKNRQPYGCPREEIRLELENAKDDYDRSIIKPIFNSLEEYTEGSCDMLAYPSTVRLDNRMIGFGLKNVPPDNWEPGYGNSYALYLYPYGIQSGSTEGNAFYRG
ncbi:hypothetical protein NIA73_14040 [Anaerobutyricum hallii]|nr:hypothetical protein [Anaerobutyricum hallii]